MKNHIILTRSLVLFAALTALAQTTYASAYSAPVQVTNPETSPVPVRVLGNLAVKPFQVTHQLINTSESSLGGATFKVPAGKRLVIEHFSIAGPAGPSGSLTRVRIITQLSGETPIYHYFVQAPVTDMRWQWVDRLTKLYADPSTDVVIGYDGEMEGGTAILSGYLEDVN